MEHLLTCGCGRKIPVSRSQAGQELSCECGQRLQVPTLRGFAELPVAGPETLPAKSYASSFTPESERRAWGGWRGTIMAISVAMLVISALPCAYFLFIRWQIDTSYGMEDEIISGNKSYDLMPMENLMVDWSNFERNGLGPKNKPRFYWLKIAARENEILAMISGAVATLSALTAIGMWASARKLQK